ncbi:tetratricopeptide repeat protein [Nitrosomonas communis]|uniref:tetratricopeptide repeat protein n=1 Tax=Nitrosomonas communis TaxID=44574 RepID=UPI0034E95B29
MYVCAFLYRSERLKITREHLQRNPNDVKHWYTFGMLLLNLNRPKAAKAAFERLLQVDPYMANVRLELAKLLIDQSNET